jgi:hypothetical protein
MPEKFDPKQFIKEHDPADRQPPVQDLLLQEIALRKAQEEMDELSADEQAEVDSWTRQHPVKNQDN